MCVCVCVCVCVCAICVWSAYTKNEIILTLVSLWKDEMSFIVRDPSIVDHVGCGSFRVAHCQLWILCEVIGLVKTLDLTQWFLSFFERDPKSGLNQKLANQALKIKRFSKHFCNNWKSAYFYLQSASKHHKFPGNTDISNSDVFCSVRALELSYDNKVLFKYQAQAPCSMTYVMT